MLMIWDVASSARKSLKLSGHTDNIFSARFLPYSDNNELVSVAADGVRGKRFSHPSGST